MSGMIYAVIVVMWAAFLVPMWLRRHDENAEAKSVDSFASKMRVLARRTAQPEPAPTRDTKITKPSGFVRAATSAPTGTISSTVRIMSRETSSVPPAAPSGLDPRAVEQLAAEKSASRRASTPKPARRVPTPAVPRTESLSTGVVPPVPAARSIRDLWADEADDDAMTVLAAPVLARDLARDRGLGRMPTTLAGRRRRVLAVLLATTLLLGGLAALSVVPLPAPVVTLVLTVAYVAHLRVQAKRTAEIARRRSRAASGGRSATQRQSAPGAAATRPATEPLSTVEHVAVDDDLDDDLDDEDAWQPVSVPVPTYVTAPRAGRAIRRIDLRSDDAWTSGRLVADAAAAGRAAAKAAHDEAVAAADADARTAQRAVGD